MRQSLPRTVIVLGWVSFFTDLSSEMIYPLLPVFLSSVLGATAFELGVIEGVADATASLLKVVSGIWTDRIKRRKPLVILGYSLSGFFRPLMGLAQSWHFVLLIRFFDRVGKGIRSSPRDALIADHTRPEQRGAAYGFHRAMDHAGAVGGPLLASLVLFIFGMTLRQIFLLSVIPAVVASVILMRGLQEFEPQKNINSTFNLMKNLKTPLNLTRDWEKLGSGFRSILFALFIFTLGTSTDAFLLVRLSQVGIPAGGIALLWSLHHGVKMISNYYGGSLSDRLGRKATLMGGWLLYSVIYLAFAWIESPKALILVFLLYGVYYGLAEPTERAWVADRVPAQLRGTAFGYYDFTIGVAALPASLLFGFVWQSFGVRSAFFTGSALAMLASGVLIFIPPVHPMNQEMKQR